MLNASVSPKPNVRDKIEPFWDNIYDAAEGYQMFLAAAGLSLFGWLGFKLSAPLVVVIASVLLYFCISRPPQDQSWVERSSRIKFYYLTRIWSGFLSSALVFGLIFSFVYPEVGGPGVYIASIAPACMVLLYVSAKYQSMQNPEYREKND